jgi:hypothetical protein
MARMKNAVRNVGTYVGFAAKFPLGVYEPKLVHVHAMLASIRRVGPT